MPVTNATLGGERLLANQGPIGWSYTSGPLPHLRTFRMERAAALRVYERSLKGEGLDLFAEQPGRKPLHVQKLRVLSTGPTNNPAMLDVLVADRRWLLPRIPMHRAYNIRRDTGERTILGEGQVPEALAVVVPVDHFKPWTLYPRDNPSEPWTARLVVEDLFEYVAPGEWRFRDDFDRYLDVDAEGGLVLFDNAHIELPRAVGLIPGANFFVDDDGHYVIYDTRNGAEAGIVESADPSIFRSVLAERADLRLSRPERVVVNFVRDVEARFDSRVENEAEQVGSVTDAEDPDDVRLIENVAPVPDYQLTMPDGSISPNGTYELFDDLFAAWAADTSLGQVEQLSHELTQLLWFNPGFFQAFINIAGVEPDAVLSRRVSTILGNYRQLYRIARKFNDRIAMIQDKRVGIWSNSKKVPAPATVYGDWTVLYTLRGGITGRSLNRTSDTFSGYAERLEDARIAPAVLSIENADLGIVRLDYQLDRQGKQATVAPGAAEGKPAADGEHPVADPRELAADRRGMLAQDLRLSSGHRVAIVLTIRPGSPNDERRLHQEIVEPDEAFGALGLSTPQCVGPEWHLFVRPDLETARFGWNDDQADALDNLLGIGGGPPDATGIGEPVNLDRLRELAVSAAAALYGRFLDRYEGTLEVGITPSIKPVGSIVEVKHEFNAGEPGHVTFCALPTEQEGEDPLTFMDEGIRRKILGLVDVGPKR